MRRFPYRCLACVTAVVGLGSGCTPEPSASADRTPIEPTHRPEAPALPPVHMDDFAWTHRPLLVFAESPGDLALAQQTGIIESHRNGLAERDMVVIEIIGTQVAIDGKPRDADAGELRTRYGIDPGEAFAVVLVGKDTGIKLRRDQPVAMDEVFALIDTMPMRRQEMGDASR